MATRWAEGFDVIQRVTRVAAQGPLVSLHQASVRLGGRDVLQGVDFAVHAGEVVVLVGSNGSGKTTLLRALHGQLDEAMSHPSGMRRASNARQAMVFQRPFLLSFSVRRNVSLALWLAKVGATAQARQARVEQALARVDLSEHMDRPARVLSGGQQQRLALARAWATEPALLFLDEPTASLDPQAKRSVEALIASFVADGMTVVMSTHNLGQAKRLATRVAYVEAGRVVCDRPTAAFFGEPLPAQAEAFVRVESVS
jgi:tungstate transport system ATP-binding protein